MRGEGMKNYVDETVQDHDAEGSVTVGSAPWSGAVSVEMSGAEGRWRGEFTPAKARQVATLLLKHADRAEGG
jgi:hypothetical protein